MAKGRRQIGIKYTVTLIPCCHLNSLNVDTATPEGELYYTMIAAFARFESFLRFWAVAVRRTSSRMPDSFCAATNSNCAMKSVKAFTGV